jgi:hypothetical protein
MRKKLADDDVYDESYYKIDTKYVYNKKIIQDILSDSFKSQTGAHLSNDLFLLIWGHIDFSFSDYNLEYDILEHIDNMYFDIVHKSSYKYKKNGKISKKLKKMYKFIMI